MKQAMPLALAALLCGCTAFPELDGTVPPALERADFPALVPVEPLIAGAQEVRIAPETAPSVLARVAALRARAARLRGPIVDSGARARMRAGVSGIVEE